MRITAILVAIIAAIIISGCGAIMHGAHQDIAINSNPNQAQVIVQGESKVTPAMFNLKRKHSYIVKISKEGYESSDIMINNKLDWTAWCDLFVFGIIPIFYDLASGAAWKLSPEEINVTLNRSIGFRDGPDKIPVSLSITDSNLRALSPIQGVTVTIRQAP